jgi:hypothetical protein
VAIGHDGLVGVDATANPIYHADLHTTPALAQASAFLSSFEEGSFHSLHT